MGQTDPFNASDSVRAFPDYADLLHRDVDVDEEAADVVCNLASSVAAAMQVEGTAAKRNDVLLDLLMAMGAQSEDKAQTAFLEIVIAAAFERGYEAGFDTADAVASDA